MTTPYTSEQNQAYKYVQENTFQASHILAQLLKDPEHGEAWRQTLTEERNALPLHSLSRDPTIAALGALILTRPDFAEAFMNQANTAAISPEAIAQRQQTGSIER